MNNKAMPCPTAPQYNRKENSCQQKAELSDEVIDHEKVAFIRQQLATGKLKVNPERLAEKMLESERYLFADNHQI